MDGVLRRRPLILLCLSLMTSHSRFVPVRLPRRLPPAASASAIPPVHSVASAARRSTRPPASASMLLFGMDLADGRRIGSTTCDSGESKGPRRWLSSSIDCCSSRESELRRPAFSIRAPFFRALDHRHRRCSPSSYTPRTSCCCGLHPVPVFARPPGLLPPFKILKGSRQVEPRGRGRRPLSHPLGSGCISSIWSFPAHSAIMGAALNAGCGSGESDGRRRWLSFSMACCSSKETELRR